MEKIQKILDGITTDMLTIRLKNMDIIIPNLLMDDLRFPNIHGIIPNLLLVMDGKRLAYKMDICVNNQLFEYLCQVIPENIPELVIVSNTDMEPLICLKSRLSEIMEIVGSNEMDHVTLGKILGYECSYDIQLIANRNRTKITYISYNDLTNINIYNYLVPSDDFNDELKSKIEIKAKEFDLTLSKYGYHVRYVIDQIPGLNLIVD